MSTRPANAVLPGLAALVVFFSAGAGPARAQGEIPDDDFRRFRIKVHEIALEMKLDGQYEQRRLRDELTQRDHLFAETSLNVDLRGSIYHPNLLEFILRPQFGLSYQRVRLDPPGDNRENTRPLQRYHVDVSVLKAKAYATHLFADRDLTFRDFDFFNRAQIDSHRYGGSTGYNAGPVPLTLSYLRTREEVTGGLIHRLRDKEEILSLGASHLRGHAGQTKLAYELNRFERGEEGSVFTAGTNHSATLLDNVSWGRNRKGELQSALLFTRTEDRTRADQFFTLNENLSQEHARRLTSNTHYAYNHRRSGETDEQAHEGTFSLTHQLYTSLTSHLQFQGLSQELRSPGSRLAIDRVGAGLAESYTKLLGSWGRLSLAGDLRVDQEHRESAGQLIMVADEAHVLADGNPVFLLQSDVRGVTRVTDGRGRAFAELLDYTLVSHGALLEIRRVPGGLIPNGSTVLVSYTAAAPPAGRFTTYTRMLQVRLELFDNLLAVYGRVNQIDNTGARFLVLQNITDRTAGAEFKWGWLQISGEQEDFQSNLSPFRSQRLSETLTYDGSTGTLLSLELNQHWLSFPGTGRSRHNTSAIARWHARPYAFLLFTLEGGVRRETGRDFDQRLTTLRSLVNFDYGKLNFDLGYEYEKESYLTDRHLKHYVFFRGNRKF
ncbi:MAG: hypothetical protein HYV95_08580 [Opitutae bacterium]|nr:hypothetical protein [Opitutae bacterium]